MIYYSPSKNGFYDDQINETIPDDKIEIDRSERRAIIDSGKSFGLGPSGKPEIKPSKWHTLNSGGTAWELTHANQTKKDTLEGEAGRQSGIRAAKEGSGLKKITIEQARSFIDDKFDNADNATELKEAIRVILKKMIPHLLD